MKRYTVDIEGMSNGKAYCILAGDSREPYTHYLKQHESVRAAWRLEQRAVAGWKVVSVNVTDNAVHRAIYMFFERDEA
jgi:hypothetical protein